MRPAHLLVLATLCTCLLAACGSTSTPGAQVETVSASGDVAGSVPPCVSAPPARAPLKDSQWYAGHDGSVGAIYNRTAGNLFVGFRANDAKGLLSLCYIPSGGSAPYSVVEQISQMRDSTIELLTLSTDSQARNGVCVAVVDPDVGYPGTLLLGRGLGRCTKAVSASREDDDVREQMSTLSEGEKVEMKLGSAVVIANRLEDDADVARQWTGADTWKVGDWARIDLTVQSL